MVIYRGTDGKPGYHQTDDIHDAVSFVEQLRNDNGVEHARIFRLEEVNFEYRPYFRVELKAGEPSLNAAPSTPAAVAAAPAVSPTVAPAASPVVETIESAPSAPSAAPSSVSAVPEPVKAPASVVAESKAAEVDPETTIDAPVTTIDAPVVDPKPTAESDNGVGARRGLFGR